MRGVAGYRHTRSDVTPACYRRCVGTTLTGDTHAPTIAERFSPRTAALIARVTSDELPQIVALAEKLPTLSDRHLERAASDAIVAAAYTAGHPGYEYLDAQALMCADEARCRFTAAGHDTGCRGQTAYDKAYAAVVSDIGYATLTQDGPVCTCSAANTPG